MISGDTPWPALTDSQRDADLQRIADLHGQAFNPLDENLERHARRTAKASA